MRLFSAVPLPTEVKDRIRDVTRNRLPVPYVNVTNAHVTLNFFGELDTDDTKRLVEIFPKFFSAQKKFDIVFDKIVKFHHQLHITVVPNPELKQLHGQMESFFESHGFKQPDREYYPHVKIATLH